MIAPNKVNTSSVNSRLSVSANSSTNSQCPPVL